MYSSTSAVEAKSHPVNARHWVLPSNAALLGALDLSLYPLAYAGGEVPEVNIGLMPALVPSYEVGSGIRHSMS